MSKVLSKATHIRRKSKTYDENEKDTPTTPKRSSGIFSSSSSLPVSASPSKSKSTPLPAIPSSSSSPSLKIPPPISPSTLRTPMRSAPSLATPGSPEHGPENDRLIKSLLKQYKHLEVELNRFNSKKYNHNKNSGALKSNILRTSLLPFLRNGHKLNRYFPKHSKVYKSLTSVITAILLKWWNSLLGNLNTTSTTVAIPSTTSSPHNTAFSKSNLSNTPELHSPIPTSDRNAYLECISRLVSLEEWNKVDEDFYQQYSSLLTSTLEYCIDKLTNLKTLPLSISAFMGKIFAYSFFTLPNVSNALLFLLNVKQSLFDASTATLQDVVNVENDPKVINYLYKVFPRHLHYLINFKGIKVSSKKQAYFLNSVPPPAHPVSGIKEPNGSWVRRWCNCDSNVFNSFFRHYIEILQGRISDDLDFDSFDIESKDWLLLNSPGFNVIFSHIQQIFQISITRISTNSVNKSQQSAQSSVPSPLRKDDMKSVPIPPPVIPNINVKHCDVYYNSITKIFRTLRDIVHSTRGKGSIPNSSGAGSATEKDFDCISTSLVRFIDGAFIAIAKETSVYDVNKNGLMLNITYEFINHLYNNLEFPTLSINWEFWLSCNYMMIKNTDHIQVVLKNLSFLFNIWDMIPESLSSLRNMNSDESSAVVRKSHPPYLDWITNLNESYKVNFINWLISSEIFQRFIVHWNPIVRSYYLRLLIWRVVGINNYQSSTMIQVTRKVQSNFDRSYDILHNFTVINSRKTSLKLDYTPDNPLVNRKFGILPINLKEDGGLTIVDDTNQDFMPTSIKNSELRKTHSYEVFDEAIYTCSSLPITADENNESDDTKKQSSKSLVSSIGKLFRYLSTDDNAEGNDTDKREIGFEESPNGSLGPQGSFKYKRNSVSLSSLSTTYSSIKSRSSSPSLMSFKSAHTSISESTTSSISDTESTLMEKNSKGYNQPPEIFKLPPEISRPIYKFDIVIDHDSMNEKFLMIHQKNIRAERIKEERLRAQNLGLEAAPGITREGSGSRKSYSSVTYFPNKPIIPLISIFISNDPYNKFYINDEDGLFIENLADNDDQDNHTIKADNSEDLFANFKLDRVSSRNLVAMTNLGKSLNELNLMIEEFKSFLNKRVEIDQFNQDLLSLTNFNEFDYFKKIIPFMSVDSSNDLKLLNAN